MGPENQNMRETYENNRVKITDSQKIEHQMRRLFNGLQKNSEDSTLPLLSIPKALEEYGIQVTDLRLSDMLNAIRAYEFKHRSQPKDISFDEFMSIVSPNLVMVEKVLQGDMVIPEFKSFTN